MKPLTVKAMLDIDGVFAAVKCSICDTVYPAQSDEYVAFFGSVTVGLDDVIIGVTPPKRPAKKAVSVVCRDPRCVAAAVQKMLGCDGEKGEADKLWAQVLKIWADEAGHELAERPETQPNPPMKILKKKR